MSFSTLTTLAILGSGAYLLYQSWHVLNYDTSHHTSPQYRRFPIPGTVSPTPTHIVNIPPTPIHSETVTIVMSPSTGEFIRTPHTSRNSYRNYDSTP